jgi:hypothetical protein
VDVLALVVGHRVETRPARNRVSGIRGVGAQGSSVGGVRFTVDSLGVGGVGVDPRGIVVVVGDRVKPSGAGDSAGGI